MNFQPNSNSILTVVLLVFLAIAFLACNGMTPDSARRELGRMNIQYNASAFIDAARNGDALAVDLFLKAGMDVNARDPAGRLAYMFISKPLSAGLELKEAVARFGTDRIANGTTALMAAAATGRVQIVSMLLAQKANLNIQDCIDMNALSYAKWAEQTEVAEMLVRAGATEPEEPKAGKAREQYDLVTHYALTSKIAGGGGLCHELMIL
jgi:hypothetical protein